MLLIGYPVLSVLLGPDHGGELGAQHLECDAAVMADLSTREEVES